MIVLLAALGIVAGTQDPHGFRRLYATPLAERLTLNLQSDQQSYYVREGIWFRLTFKNVGKEPVAGVFMPNPIGPKASLYYRRPEGRFTPFGDPEPRGGYVVTPRTLKPEEELTGRAFILYDLSRRAFVLEEPGVYEFKVVYEDAVDLANAVLVSNVVRLEVMSVPNAEQEAAAAFSKELAYLLQFYSDRLYATPAVILEAVGFVERFPGSLYSGPVRGALREALSHRIRRQEATATEQEVYERLRAQDAVKP